MITSSFMYWITRLDSICCAICVLSAIFIGAALVTGIPLGIEYFSWADCDRKYRNDINDTSIPAIRKVFLWMASIGVMLLVVSSFIPTTKEAAAIVVVPKIANSESVAEISTAVKDSAVKWLKEAAAEVEK